MIRPAYVLFGLFALGCDRTPTPEAPAPEQAGETGKAKAPTPPTDEVQLPPGDGPVARVNGQEIPREVFNREYRQTIERYTRARHEVKPALRERLKDNIVGRLVDQEIIRQQAAKLGVVIEPDVLESRWTEHKKRYGSPEAFDAFLERAGTTAADVRRNFDQNHLREAVFARIGEQVTVSGEEARAFFEKNKKRYEEPAMVRASHILIRVPPGADEKVVSKKRELAKTIRREASAKGADFAELAKKHGEDPTKDRGGDLGYFPKGRMVKAFEKAAWNLKKGQISRVVKTQFGFHIIKKTDARPASKKRFSEVSDQIERSLLAQNRNKAIRETLEKWKKDAELDLYVKGDPEIINAAYEAPVRTVPMPAPNADLKLNEKLKLDRAPKPVVAPKPAPPTE